MKTREEQLPTPDEKGLHTAHTRKSRERQFTAAGGVHAERWQRSARERSDGRLWWWLRW